MFYKTDEPHGLPHSPFKSCVVPRPIAWVSSVHENGTPNLAPYSFYNAISDEPPMVMLSFTGYHQHGGEKDTLSNIKNTKEFVVNVVPAALMQQMNTSTSEVPSEVNEIDLAGLTPVPSKLVKPPRIAESPIHLECSFYQEIKLPCTAENSINTTILGTVLGVHISDNVLVDGMVDLSLVKPLARLGYRQYTSVNDIFELARPNQTS